MRCGAPPSDGGAPYNGRAMGVEDRDYHRDGGGASGAGFIRSCPRCGRSFPAALWRMHAHNPQQARCGEAGCLERGVGYRPDAPSAEAPGPLCAEHLMRYRRQGHDVRFVDGGVCSVCDGHGQTASHTGEWMRCPQCLGAGYESEDVVERRRERARQEEKEARRREENRRAAEEARRRSEEASRAAEERRRSEARHEAEEERRRSEARQSEEERRRSEARQAEEERRRAEARYAEEERRRAEARYAEEERRRQTESSPWGGYAGRAAQGQCPSCGGAGRVATKYHRVLDIPLGASPDEITQAFRRKAMQHHPDRNKAPDATLRMQEVSEARAMLVGSESIRAGAECSLCNGRGAVSFEQPWQGQAQRGQTEREPAGRGAGGAGAYSGSGGGQSGSGGGSSGGSGWGWFWIAAVIGVFAAFVYFSRETPSPAFSPAASAPTRTPQAVRAFNPTPTATPRATPTPLSAVAATWTPNPTWTPQPTWTPTPTATPNPTWTPAPTWTPTPAMSDGATAVRAPPPQPTATPTPRPTPRPTATPRPATGQESLEAVAARVRPSVVHVTAGRSAGSGVIVETDSSGRAIIVTNHHVIEDSPNRVRVQVEDSSWHSAVVHGSDAARDLAVLSICCSPDFRAASLSGARAPQGASVFAMGYPVDVFDSGVASLTDGVVSRVFLDTEGRRWLVQTNAEINPGNSGGPLFAMSGEVVGINAFIQRETAGGLNIEGYGFAISSETVIDVLPTLKAGRTLGGATPTPRLQPTPIPWRGSRNRFGPTDGAMPNEDDNYIETYYAGLHIRALSAQATFHNPSSSVGGWDYGFLFRSAGDNRFHAVVVTVNGTWFHYLRNGSSDGNTIDSGHADALRTWDGAPNELRLVAIASIGWFFINGELVATLDLTDGPAVGDVSLVTDYHLAHERDGGLTRFQGFAVREPRLVETASGELAHADDGLIKSQWVTSGVGDFIVSATFINPYPADVGSWDYGVAFRDDPNRRNAFDAVAVGSDGSWEHFRRDGANASVHSDSGRARVNLGEKAGNTLWLMAVGGAGVLSVNREPADALDLSGAPLRGGVWVGTGFYEGNEVPGYATSYADVEIWSLD